MKEVAGYDYVKLQFRQIADNPPILKEKSKIMSYSLPISQYQ